MTHRSLVSVLVFVGVLVVVLRVIQIPVPLERDEGAYAYIALRLNDGEVPYRDIFEHKPPFIFLVYWLAMALFGKSPWAIHVFMNLYSFISALVIWHVGQRMFSPRAGSFAAIAFLALSLSPSLSGQSANTEIFMAPFLALGMLFLWRRDLFLAGVSLGVAFFFKQTAYAFIIVAGLCIVFEIVRARERLRGVGYFVAGVLTPALVVVLYFAFYGALGNFYENTVVFNAHYAGALSSKPFAIIAGRFFAAAKHIFYEDALYIFVALLGIFAVKPTRSTWYLVGWFFASLVAVATGWRFFGHYFIIALPAAALAVGIGFDYLLEKFSASATRTKTVFVHVAIAAVLLSPFVAQWNYWRLSAASKSRFIYPYPSNFFVEAPRVADYIKQNTDPRDTLFIFGSEPEILFLAGRKSASRYTSLSLLEADRGEPAALETELAANNPAYIVYMYWQPPLGAKSADPITAAVHDRLRDSYILDGIVMLDDNPENTTYIFGHERAYEAISKEDFMNRTSAKPKIALYKRK